MLFRSHRLFAHARPGEVPWINVCRGLNKYTEAIHRENGHIRGKCVLGTIVRKADKREDRAQPDDVLCRKVLQAFARKSLDMNIP